jgi:hypothetical protein
MKIEKWMWLVGLVSGAALCLLSWGLATILLTPTKLDHAPTAALTLIPFQTLTPSPESINLSAQTSSTDIPSNGSQIAPGMFVQITGTGGDGLHIRSGPGTTYQSNFIGMENEVFQVEQGPEYADGFTWWFLSAPYDDTRNGWAVENYLSIIN